MKLQLPRSFTFRLSLTYIALFGVSVLLLMLFIYWATAAYMARQTDAVIEAEIGGLADLVWNVAEYYEPLAEAREQTLEVHTNTEVKLSGDRDLLSRVLANLLDNAIKYTPPGGRIAVILARIGPERAELVVSDSGPGIPLAARQQIFQRFFRWEASRSTPGSGLGLSLVEAVARLHGIAIEIADNAPGARVVLRFATLPVTADDPTSMATTRRSQLGRILVWERRPAAMVLRTRPLRRGGAPPTS